MILNFFKLTILGILLGSCTFQKYFRAKNLPLAEGDFKEAPDAPALIDSKNSIIEIRSKSFNNFIHVSVVIKPKMNEISYSLNKVKLVSLKNGFFYLPTDLQTHALYLCPERPWTNPSLKTFAISKNCPLKINYLFDTSSNLKMIFQGSWSAEVMKGFSFVDSGFETEDLKVEFQNFNS